LSRPAHPLPDSYWFGPGLLAGPRPADATAVRTLLRVGVRTVVDLRTPAEPPSVRVALTRRCETASFVQVPIQDGRAPAPETLVTLLDLLDGHVRRERGLYLHCQGGRGRTGTVVAAWWIRHGQVDDSDGAIARLRGVRAGEPHGDHPSPETAEQLRLLRQWHRGR
jgi:hypothetical protein